MNVSIGLKAIATIMWIVVVGLFVLALIRASRGSKVKGITTSLLVLAVVAGLLTILAAGLVFIQPEERGVVISAVAPGGYRPAPLSAGLHWIIPFLENVKTYPISRQTYTMSILPSEGQVQGDDSISARTADGQEVFIDASVIYSVDPDEVINVHIAWQDRYKNDLVRPLARGVIRDAVSQYGIEEVYSSKRAEMTQQIQAAMEKKLNENGLQLLEFVMRNITFSPEYAASVEQKQIAEQQAEQAKFVVEQRKQEAEQARQVAEGQADAVVINAKGLADARVIQADAEAKALDLIALALAKSPDLLQYVYITKLAPNLQVMLLPNNTPFLFPLPTITPQNSTPTATPTPTPLPTPQPTPTP